MKLTEKKAIVESLHNEFEKSQIVLLTDFKGLNVKAVTELRRKLNAEGVHYKVVKNTLANKASEDTDVSLIKDQLKGPCAIAYSYEDPVAPAKVLSEFSKDNDNLKIKIGVMNGKILDQDAIEALSALPSREVLLAQLLSAINGVPTGFVRALNDVPTKLLNVIQAIKDQKEAA